MTRLEWDKKGERRYENGVSQGVLYVRTGNDYGVGVNWNGLTNVTESPEGGEASGHYADNLRYVMLTGREEMNGTIEAFTYPDEFEECDGTASPEPGVRIRQQTRVPFGFCYRTEIGTDLNPDAGYKLHLVYDATAKPTEKAHATVGDSEEPDTFSWEFWTTKTAVGEINGVEYKPTSSLEIDSTEVDAADLAELEDLLYGTDAAEPSLPSPAEVIAIFSTAAA